MRAPERKLRVLFINDTSRNGGPGRTLFYILKFLNTERVHRAVVVPREGVISNLLREGGVADELFCEPGLVENLVEPWDRSIQRDDFEAPVSTRGMRAIGNVLRGGTGLFRLVDLATRGKYDVIFCNGTTANFAGGAIAAFTGIPAVWHVFYTSVAKPIEALHGHLAAGKNVRSIVCVSKPTTCHFVHCMNKVRVVHDAIDIEEFDRGTVAPVLRKELGLGDGATIFGSQGRILPRKGYVEMIRAARVALERMNADERLRAHFVVLGDTPEDMRPDHLQECRALVTELGLEKSVHFVGFRPDVKPYVGDFDVAVVPSIYEDPLPRAVIESMAMRKPVVAFDVGGISEMIEHGVSGALVRGTPPDLSGLADEFLRYLRDPELRQKHGEAARARVEADLDARGHAKALEDELFRVAGR